jgi:hypothetical protein
MDFKSVVSELSDVMNKLFGLVADLRKDFNSKTLAEFCDTLNSVQNPLEGTERALYRESIRENFTNLGVPYARLLAADRNLRPLILWTGGREITSLLNAGGFLVIRWNRLDKYNVTRSAGKSHHFKDKSGFIRVRRGKRNYGYEREGAGIIENLTLKEKIMQKSSFASLNEEHEGASTDEDESEEHEVPSAALLGGSA